MAEPRPQYLVTGDRAVSILDASSSAALQANGVKLTTLSLPTFEKLIDELIPSQPEIDPETGKFLPAYMPDYLTEAAISELDLLDPTTHQVEEQFIPTRLSQTAISAMVLAQNSTVVETDPDGYPVVVGGAETTTDYNVTGNLTAGNLSASTAHADVLTANQASFGYAEADTFATDNQSTEPAAPAAGRVKVYTDANGRLKAKDASAKLFLIGNKRIVTAWPTASDSQLGDEAIHSTTGEHRIYLGATKGWRLASTHEVSSLTERDAITDKYTGLRVHVAAGVEQDHVYGADGKWHGTQSFQTPIVGNFPVWGVNDTNWRVLYSWDLVDPGFPYIFEIKAGFELVAFNVNQRTFVQMNTSDYKVLDHGAVGMAFFFQDAHQGWAYGVHRYDIAAETQYVLEGSHSTQVYWKFSTNWCNGYTANYLSYATCRVHPA